MTDTQPPRQTRCRSKDAAYYVARVKIYGNDLINTSVPAGTTRLVYGNAVTTRSYTPGCSDKAPITQRISMGTAKLRFSHVAVIFALIELRRH